MKLKSLNVAELLNLRNDITETLQVRKSELEALLSEFDRPVRSKKKPVRLKRSKVAAKYRHPKTGEE